MPDPVVKSEAAGKVTRVNGKPVKAAGYKAKMKNNANVSKSYSESRVTGDPGDYTRRKKVRSLKKGLTKRDVNGRGVETKEGSMQKKYGN